MTRVGVEGSWEVLASLYVFAAIEKGGLPGYVFKSRIDSLFLLEDSGSWSSREKVFSKAGGHIIQCSGLVDGRG